MTPPLNARKNVIFALLGTIFMSACEDRLGTRNTLNSMVSSKELSNGLSIRVVGGSIMKTNAVDLSQLAQPLTIRTQSMDMRIDLKSRTCAPSVVHLEVTHAGQSTPDGQFRVFFDALDPVLEATRTSLAGVTQVEIDSDSPDWTPLSDTRQFQLEPVAETPRKLRWTVCLDRVNRYTKLLSGYADFNACNFPEASLSGSACGEPSTQNNQDIASGGFVVRHRIKWPISRTTTIAVWGNDYGDETNRAKLVTALNADRPDIVILNGDITKTGTAFELNESIDFFDGQLDVPWVATLGDRDVINSGSIEYINRIGSSTFAFDLGATRVIVLDSADQALGLDARTQLETWLTQSPLSWRDARPSSHLVVTHVPPFDPSGHRGAGLKQRHEGASFVALASRSLVPYIITSQLSEYAVTQAGQTRIVHCGGGGGNGGPLYWLRVTIDQDCQVGEQLPCRYPDEAGLCPCILLEKVPL
ncbi:MAG: metallophosphoesterase [Myxococcota bacterium]|nr:metallophosphoesterase [Myxococcota bacterium]